VDTEDEPRSIQGALVRMQAALSSMLVHIVLIIVLIIVLGLMFVETKVPASSQLEVTQTIAEELPPVETLVKQIEQTDHLPTVSLDAFNLVSEAPSNAPLTLAEGATTMPLEIGEPGTTSTDLSGELLASSATGGIGGELGGAFEERLGRAGAQTGVVQVSLVWDNENDLDIHVVSPLKEHIFFAMRRAPSGGHLDVDMNSDVSRLTQEPVENIYWSTSRAPRGIYRVYVHFYSRHDEKQDATAFRCAVKIGNDIKTIVGKVSTKDNDYLVGTFNRR
jgi:hypothetical protein